MPVDLLVYYSDEFNERAKLICTFEWQILHDRNNMLSLWTKFRKVFKGKIDV